MSCFTLNSNRGFVFTLEVVLIIIVVFAVLVGSQLIVQKHAFPVSKTYSQQIVDDSYTAMLKTGYLASVIDQNGFDYAADDIYARTKSLIPADFNLAIRITEFALDENACREHKTFAECFPDMNRNYVEYGPGLPQDRDITYLKKNFILKQPAGECDLNYQIGFSNSAAKISKIMFSEPEIFSLDSGISLDFDSSIQKILFADANDLNVLFDVNVTPAGTLECDQTAIVDLAAIVPPYGRAPVAIMLVQDRSGSMSWDGLFGLNDPNDLYFLDPYLYVADDSSGLRIVNTSDPLDLSTTGTYNSPGTAYGVHAVGNYAYLADGSSGFRIVNTTNKSSPSSAGSLTTIGTASNVFVSGNYAYVTTTSDGSTDYLDLENTGTSNTDLYIGRDSGRTYAAQSFIPASNSIRAVAVNVKKTSSTPADNLVIRLRQTLGGADLATASINRNSITTSYAWYTGTFSNNISLTPGQTYYLVLTTGTTSGTRYYSWASINTDPYANGNAYQEANSLSTTDAFFRTYHRARTGLQIIDISSPASPAHKSSISGTDPQDIYVSGNYAYFTDGTAGLRIIDITNPLAPSQIGIIDTTDAMGISVNGDYAYLADGSAGLRVINIANKSTPSISGTYNTPGTAYDSFYYTDGNVYVADNSALLAINVSASASPTLGRTYSTPYDYYDVQIANGYAFLSPGYNNSIVSFSLSSGPKIDQSKVSASEFIDNDGWKNSDKAGIVSFSDSTSTNQTLKYLDDANKTLLKSTLNSLNAGGGTAIGDAIYTATTELRSARVRPDDYKFQVLLSDGQSNAGSSPILAAQDANNRGITIYTIAFGPDADYATLASIANITGGKSYLASDENALREIYDFISGEIGYKASGGSREEAYNAILRVPVMDGTEIVDYGGSVLEKINDQNYLRFYIGFMDYNSPWHGSYGIRFPCNDSHTCYDINKMFPPSGTYFEYDNNVGISQDDIYWDKNEIVAFKYRDLKVAITKGALQNRNLLYIDLNAYNFGYLNSGPTRIDIYLNEPGTPDAEFIKSESVPSLCAGKGGACASSILIRDVPVEREGYIYAWINPDSSTPECPNNNMDMIYCVGGPMTKYYLLEYWTWVS